MSSNVDRQAVLRNTKVRTALRKDGSWIHRSSEELSDNHEPSEPPVPVKLVGSRLFSTAAAQTPPSPAPQNQDTPTTPDTPTAPDTPTTPDTPTAPDTPTSPVGKGSPRSSYVFSAIRKFENTESPDSSPVKTSHSSQMVKREMFPENAASGWKTPLTPAKTQPVPHATSAKPSGIAPTTFAKQPTTKTSITQKPVVKTPAAQTPAVKELAETARPTLPQVKTPAERVPVAETPAAKTPQVKTPAEKVPLAETPAAKTPQVKTQAEKVPVAETAAAKTPEVKTPAEKVPVAETPAAKTPEVKTPAEKVPVAETPAVKTHQVKTPAEKVPVAETPAVKTPQVKTPAEKVPVAETPAVKTAVPKIPVTETPAVPEPEVKTPAPPAVNLLPETSEPRAAPQIVLEPAASRTTSSKPQLIGASNPLCSFCMKPVDGRVKITITDPLICCHQDCFKCATCSVPLGDLVFAMFHHKGKIHCEKCFSAIFSHS